MVLSYWYNINNKQWGLTFQNYRKTQIASRATRSQFSCNMHLNRKELLAKLTLTKNSRHSLKIKWFAIKQIKTIPLYCYMWKQKMKRVCQTQLDTPPPPPPTYGALPCRCGRKTTCFHSKKNWSLQALTVSPDSCSDCFLWS